MSMNAAATLMLEVNTTVIGSSLKELQEMAQGIGTALGVGVGKGATEAVQQIKTLKAETAALAKGTEEATLASVSYRASVDGLTHSYKAVSTLTKDRVKELNLEAIATKKAAAEAKQYQKEVTSGVASLRASERADDASNERRLRAATAVIKARQAAEEQYTAWWAKELAEREQAERAAIMSSVGTLRADEAEQAASNNARLALALRAVKDRQAVEAGYTAWWAKELAKQDALYAQSVRESVATLKERELAQRASDRERLESTNLAIHQMQAKEAEYTAWWVAELSQRDAAYAASQLKRAQLMSKFSSVNAERLDRGLVAPAPGKSALAQDYLAAGAVMGGGSALARAEADAALRMTGTQTEAAQATKNLNAELASLNRIKAGGIKTTDAATRATGRYTDSQWQAHAAARGLAGSLGQLWMTYGALAPLLTGAALGAAFKSSTSMGMEFEYQLTFVKALGEETTESINNLRQASLQLANDGLYGPVELASGLRVLAQAGLSATEAIEGMPHVLNLATVGEMQMSDAAVTLVGVMEAFKLNVDDFERIGDVFAKAAAESQTGVEDMTQAMRMASVVGEQYNVSMADTATILTILAKLNIQGTAAGTAMRNMAKELYTPLDRAQKLMETIGLKTRTASGELRNVADILYDLRGILTQYDKGSQTDILQGIFGERGAKPAVAAISEVREEYDRLRASISQSTGFMESVATQLENTTKGSLKQAVNALQVALIEVYQTSEGTIGQIAADLKTLFQSDGFKDGLGALVQIMASLTGTLIELAPTLTKVAVGWLAIKGAMLTASMINGVAAAWALLGGAQAAWAAATAPMVLTSLGRTQAGLTAVAAAAATGGRTAAAGAMGAAAGAAGALLSAVRLLLGPVGLVATAVATLGYKLYDLHTYAPDSVSGLDKVTDALFKQTDQLKKANDELERKLGLEGKQGAPLKQESDVAQREIALAKLRLDQNKRDYENTSPVFVFDRLKLEKEREQLTSKIDTLQRGLLSAQNEQQRAYHLRRAKESADIIRAETEGPSVPTGSKKFDGMPKDGGKPDLSGVFEVRDVRKIAEAEFQQAKASIDYYKKGLDLRLKARMVGETEYTQTLDALAELEITRGIDREKTVQDAIAEARKETKDPRVLKALDNLHAESLQKQQTFETQVVAEKGLSQMRQEIAYQEFLDKVLGMEQDAYSDRLTAQQRFANEWAKNGAEMMKRALLANDMDTVDSLKRTHSRGTEDARQEDRSDLASMFPEDDELRMEMLKTRHDKEREAMLKWTKEGTEERNRLELTLTAKHNGEMTEARMAGVQGFISAGSEMAGAMLSITKNVAGEQSDAYRAMFAISKGFAIAEATMNVALAISKASVSLPFPANLASMATVASAVAGLVGQISSVTYSGAYDKGGTIPGGQWGIVGEYGPEIVQGPAQVTSRQKTAEMIQQAAQGGQQQAPAPAQNNIRIVNAFDSSVVGDYIGSTEGERVVMNVVKKNQTAIKRLASA